MADMQSRMDKDSDPQVGGPQGSVCEGADACGVQQGEQLRCVPMSQWRAATVLAWIHVAMAMPMYARACQENVKSGKVLLALTDEDLEEELGISNQLHRRKIRLAIEDHRQAEQHGQGLSKASELDHQWVSEDWLSDVGLPQYGASFRGQLVDGRLLGTLDLQDLQERLHITHTHHQTSLLTAIQMLQALNYDREALQARRARCEDVCVDPLVWTNQRVIKWIRDIDLQEFADSLVNSGVHGAMLVLDSSFSSESLAHTLGIPTHRTILQRHLQEELHTLRSKAQQESEKLMPPQHQHPPAALSRLSEERSSLRHTNTGKSPLRFNPRLPGGRDLSLHGSCGSLPRDEMKASPRPQGSPLHKHTHSSPLHTHTHSSPLHTHTHTHNSPLHTHTHSSPLHTHTHTHNSPLHNYSGIEITNV